MAGTKYIKGDLLSQEYLENAIRNEPEWSEVDIDSFVDSLRDIFHGFPAEQEPNESQTEDDFIWPVLQALGWSSYLRQQSLSYKGSVNIPDGLLFIDDKSKEKANSCSEQWKRYEFGVALVESKRWSLPLDRESRVPRERSTPSTQMLRYLRRVDDLTNGSLRWGILTNGAVWRLYYQGARSVSEQFLEIDLYDLYRTLTGNERIDLDHHGHIMHCLRVFVVMFQRSAFELSGEDLLSYHHHAIKRNAYYEERVRNDLSKKVFEKAFPLIANGLHDAAPDARLEEIRDSAFILLFRLLFIFYAEDRDLLPMSDERYQMYSLRNSLRVDVGRFMDARRQFSGSVSGYWSRLSLLCNEINSGDNTMGLPAYNGRLFDPKQNPLLSDVTLPDSIVVQIVDLLSYSLADGVRRYINYKDLSIQHLGSIYERLMEFELYVDHHGALSIRPNTYARKTSGSYYTPDDLVQLVVHETVSPLVSDCFEPFRRMVDDLTSSGSEIANSMKELESLDPATRILNLRICDPAMGSGHFLVSLVDYLAAAAIGAIAEAEELANLPVDAGYVSPLRERVSYARETIVNNAKRNGWALDEGQLDDRLIIRRIVLKRCIYGVDKNEMAVELAKVSLWLHTFTTGAPLSFLDHHLRCGNSLFGANIRRTLEKVESGASGMFLRDRLLSAYGAVKSMRKLEALADSEMAEVHLSYSLYREIESETRPLKSFLDVVHALEWLKLRSLDDRAAINMWLDGQFGDTLDIVDKCRGVSPPNEAAAAQDSVGSTALPGRQDNDDSRSIVLRKRFSEILAMANNILDEEKFFNWQLEFLGVWKNWEGETAGGFDAVVGNPPWDRVKLQQAWWFIMRYPDFDKGITAADRTKLVSKLAESDPEMSAEYNRAAERAKATSRMARKCGDYPQLSVGDVNLQSLFVERGLSLLRHGGMLGFLVPTGIATDKSTSKFFRKVMREGSLKCLYDFENNKALFSEVDSRFKFCVFVAGESRRFEGTQCAFFLRSTRQIADNRNTFTMTHVDLSRINPNTGTMPIFRTRRDADLTLKIYERMPVFVKHASNDVILSFPAKYHTMFHVAGDSDKFRNSSQLKNSERAWPVSGSRWESESGMWLPLYTGRMIQHYDHRFASAVERDANPYRTTQSEEIEEVDKMDPGVSAVPQFWVNEHEISPSIVSPWLLAFRNITSATNMRTMIATAIPFSAVGHSAPLLLPGTPDVSQADLALLLGNLNSTVFDFVARQKVQSNNFTWYTLEQLPVVPLDTYSSLSFGQTPVERIVRESVLELCYTSNDMSEFAQSLGFVDEKGAAKPPFEWDAERRLRLRAKLDAVYFCLYGVFDPNYVERSRDDISYMYSTFPIVRKLEANLYGTYRTRELALAYCNSLISGAVDAEPDA